MSGRWGSFGDPLTQLSLFAQRAFDDYAFTFRFEPFSGQAIHVELTSLTVSAVRAALAASDGFDFTPAAALQAPPIENLPQAGVSLTVEDVAPAIANLAPTETSAPDVSLKAFEAYTQSYASTYEIMSHASGLQVYPPHTFDLK